VPGAVSDVPVITVAVPSVIDQDVAVVPTPVAALVAVSAIEATVLENEIAASDGAVAVHLEGGGAT
jgi:hypothetical protein